MDNAVAVSVVCCTYNHENYIRNALDGFVMQKTNFQFEVLVHDDASTDHTRDIIDEYARNYPNIIIPIYEKENQYSKNIRLLFDIMIPRCKGKYIALCDGDDFWTDYNKLQIQYDFLEKNIEVSACFHNYRVLEMENETEHDVIDIEGPYSIMQIFDGWKKGTLSIHAMCIMFRGERMHEELPQYLTTTAKFEDLPLFFYMALIGDIYVLPQIMATYRHGTSGSYTKRKISKEDFLEDIEQKVLVLYKMLDYLDADIYGSFIAKIKEMIIFEEYRINVGRGRYRMVLRWKYRKNFFNEKIMTQIYIVWHAIINK